MRAGAAGGARGHVRVVLGRGRARGGGCGGAAGASAGGQGVQLPAGEERPVERDAADLADLARMGRLPEAWIAPPQVRALREVVRYRHKLVGQRTSCKDQVHAVLAKLGVPVTHSDIFGTGGGLWLDQLVLPAPYGAKVASLRALIGVLDGQITALGGEAASMLAGDKGYQALRELPGIGPVLAAVICAEIGRASCRERVCWIV